MNRDKQIEEMARVMCGREKSCLICPIESPCLMRNCAHLLYAEGYRKQEWISVDEALPKKYENVLVCCANIVGTDFIMAKGVWYRHLHNEVTHWMPLPEPPKMKGGE